MDWLQALILGIVQGLTEFLPISSSAHLLIVSKVFFGGRDAGAAFTAVTQLGTETAVLVFFYKDILRIIKHWFGSLLGKVPRNDPDARMGWLVIIGSLPIGLLGFFGKHFIEGSLRNLWITATMLALFALIISIADKQFRHYKPLEKLSWRDGIIFGFAQACALIPGVSRSGGTIAAGLFMGYKREAAARYSFLLAIPAVFISGLYELKDAIKDPSGFGVGPIVLATAVAFIIGYLVIAWLIRYISSNSFRPFVWYRLGLSAVIMGLLVTGVVAAV